MNLPDEAAKEAVRRQEQILTRLRNDLKNNRLAIITGAGVTLNVTADVSGKPLTRITWTGLIRNGLDYLVHEGYVGKSNRRTKRAYDALEDPEVNGLLDAADIMSSQMKQHGQFATWLESVFGSLSQEVRHPALMDVLKALYERGATLLTTYYDDILEKQCGIDRISRSNQDDISRFQRGDLNGVFHIHGSYHDVHEVVLDTTDYYGAKHSDEVQDILKTFLKSKTVLFVGCGSGLEDPNFDVLLKWASERETNIPHRHCLLVRDEDSVKYQPLVRVKYGPTYENLVVYLKRLLDDRIEMQSPATSIGLGSRTPVGHASNSRKICLKRDLSECIRSLCFKNMTSRRNNISLAHQDTCEWLFKAPSFIKWKDRTDVQSNNGILWMKGHPGVGKSTLMKHTLLYCQEEFKGHNIAFYFFNARGGPLEKCPLGMLRSLIVQLLEQYPSFQDHFIPYFLNKKIRHRISELEWETGELKEIFLREYKTRQFKDTLLIIDALDECNDLDVQEVMDFFEDLSENAIQSDSTLRICLSSRHYPYIDTKKKIELVIEQQAEHDEDIFKYVQSKLRATNGDIQRRILDKAQHIFIWVVLVIQLLNIEFTKGKIKAMWKKLDEIPSDLNELFSRLVEKEDSEDNKKTAILIFQWVLFSVQPITPIELYFAVLAGTDPDDLGAWDPSEVEFETIKRFITTASRGLVEIVPDRGTVQFIHQSLVDFITRNQRLVKLDPILAPSAVGASHARLVSCCMAYIMQEELRSLAMEISSKVVADELEESYPLLQYTLKNLFAHAENAQAEGISPISLLRRVEKYGGYEILQSMRSSPVRSNEDFKGAQLLYVVSLQGYYCLVRALLLEHNANANAQGGYFGTALQAVAYQGFIDIVTLLLDHGANVNAQGGYFGTALQAATYEGFIDIVTLLLDRGANVNAQGGFYGTALQAAADQGSTNIIALLLGRGANVNAQGGFYGTALQAAAVAQDSTDTVSLLLECGANVNAHGGQFSTALQAAVAQGSTDIVPLLLERGANINAQGGFYGTALQAAAAQGSTNIVVLLLERGADVNAQGGFYGTALQAAAYWGFADIVMLLLDRGANITAQGAAGRRGRLELPDPVCPLYISDI